MFTFKYLSKLAILLTLCVVPLFGFWDSGETAETNNQWYYSRSEITPTFNNTVPELILDGRVVMACNEKKELNVYMQFSDEIKLETTIQLVNRDLYDVGIEFDGQNKKTTGALYQKRSTVIEFADDKFMTRSLRDGFEVLVTLPWRNNEVVSFLVSLDEAFASISGTLGKCGIEFEEDY